ncbi:hypothetical protein OROHE_021279 [Orobanche hederae]
MLENKRPPRNGGFYVRMKLPHNTRHNRNSEIKTFFCYRSFKWFI